MKLVKTVSAEFPMADPLYLSLWFPDFDVEDMLPRTLAVMRQFPFSAQQPGISYVALYPVSWNEPTIFEQRFRVGICPRKLCRSRPIYCTRITRICSKRIGICGLSQRRLSSGLFRLHK